jgi:hypothetical protein
MGPSTVATVGRSSTFSVALRINKQTFNFLVDTGAAVSLVSPSMLRHIPVSVRPSAVALHTADAHPLPVLGEVTLTLTSKNLRREFQWTFIVADVFQPMLGADFLSHHRLSVDCYHGQIVDNETKLASTLVPSQENPQYITPIATIPPDVPPFVTDLLKNHASITSPWQITSHSSPIITLHVIETTCKQPIYSKPRRLAPDKLAVAQSEFEFLVKSGIARRSSSPWSSPLHMVPKSDGSWRPCGDYRQLNSVTKADRYPLPRLTDFVLQLQGTTVYSKLDLVKAYYNIPIHADDISKTAITTPFGLFEFLFLPFGLRNASQTFQRFMDTIFKDLPFAFVYVDDLLVASRNIEEHKSHLSIVLQRLSKYNLRINIQKCLFGVNKLTFLGYTVTPQGISPPRHQVEAIIDYPLPNDYAGLRRFLGMIGFYRMFIPNFATIVAPLQDLVGSTCQRNHSLIWNDHQKDALKAIKQELVNSVTLCYLNSDSQVYHLVTDASNVGLGAALHQIVNGHPQPIGFFSRKLSSAERNYSAFDKELLAAHSAVIHFQHLIDGRAVTLFTDHKPLVHAFHSPRDPKSPRQQRHLSTIAECITDVQHISGADNIVADSLSRGVNSLTLSYPDLESIATAQGEDPEVQSLKTLLTPFPLCSGRQILCDTSSEYPRPCIPQQHRRSIFECLHGMAHPGTKSSISLVASRYFWPQMKKDIKAWVRECLTCQQSKINRHNHTLPKQSLYPFHDRFQVVHLDIVGRLSPSSCIGSLYSSDAQYIVTFMDRATRWFECIPVKDITVTTIVEVFLSHWISRFGVPLILVTDQGRQFEAELFTELSKLIGFHRFRTTAYHPQSNGLLERFHRTLKAALRAHKNDWLMALPIVCLGLRCIPNENGLSPFTAVTGSDILVPAHMFDSVKMSNTQQLEAIQSLCRHMKQLDFCSLSRGLHHSQKHSTLQHQFQPGDHAWLRIDRVRKPLEAPYQGPYKILDIKGKVVRLSRPDGEPFSVALDRIKPAILPSHQFISNRQATDNNPDEQTTIQELPQSLPQPLPNPALASTSSSDVETRSGRRIKWNNNPDYFYY